jgi:hypothetical protein
LAWLDKLDQNSVWIERENKTAKGALYWLRSDADERVAGSLHLIDQPIQLAHSKL